MTLRLSPITWPSTGFRFAIVAGCLGVLASCVGSYRDHGEPALIADVSIKEPAARSIALQARSGDVKLWKIDHSAADGRISYSYQIFHRRRMYHVRVDAQTGAILENDQKFDD